MHPIIHTHPWQHDARLQPTPGVPTAGSWAQVSCKARTAASAAIFQSFVIAFGETIALFNCQIPDPPPSPLPKTGEGIRGADAAPSPSLLSWLLSLAPRSIRRRGLRLAAGDVGERGGQGLVGGGAEQGGQHRGGGGQWNGAGG